MTKSGQGIERESLIPVRFVPLLPVRRRNCDRGRAPSVQLSEFRRRLIRVERVFHP